MLQNNRASLQVLWHRQARAQSVHTHRRIRRRGGTILRLLQDLFWFRDRREEPPPDEPERLGGFVRQLSDTIRRPTFRLSSFHHQSNRARRATPRRRNIPARLLF